MSVSNQIWLKQIIVWIKNEQRYLLSSLQLVPVQPCCHFLKGEAMVHSFL